MAIAFPCHQCGKTVTAPAGMAGKRAQCPFCKAVVAVPVPLEPEEPAFQLEPAEEEPAETTPLVEPTAPTQPKASADSPRKETATEKIVAACEHCKKKIRLPATAVGKKARCPNCKELFRVAAPQSTSPAGSAPEVPVEEAPKPQLKLILKLPIKPASEENKPPPAAPLALSARKVANPEDDLLSFAEEPSSPIKPAKQHDSADVLIAEEEPSVSPAELAAQPTKSDGPVMLEPPDEEGLQAVEEHELGLGPLGNLAVGSRPWDEIGSLSTMPALANANPYAASASVTHKTPTSTHRSGVPWQEEFSVLAYLRTLGIFLVKPDDGFRRLDIRGSALGAYGFYSVLILPIIIANVVFFLNFVDHGLNSNDPESSAGLILLFVFLSIPLLSPIFWAFSFHLLMRGVGTYRGFKPTFLAVCYLKGAISFLSFFSCCGTLISFFWIMIVMSMAMNRIHRISVGDFFGRIAGAILTVILAIALSGRVLRIILRIALGTS